jgi:hypothetical protein
MEKNVIDFAFFNSEAQERLSALLAKTIDVVPFANDDDCDAAFSTLAEFCNAALESRRERKRAKFSSMPVEDLIALAGNMHDPGAKKLVKVVGLDKKVVVESREKEKEEEKKEKEEEEGNDEGPHVGAQLMESNDNAGVWSFEQAYNIVRVVRVEVDPILIEVMARPPVAGNQKPVASIMDASDLESVGMHKGRSGTKLRKTLSQGLLEYGRSYEAGFSRSLLAQLKEYEWSKEIAEELEKLRQVQ